MELLGTREGEGISGISCSEESLTSFVAVSSCGVISLWDLRLKSKCYASIASSTRGGSVVRSEPSNSCTTNDFEGDEVLLIPGANTALCLGGSTLELFDIRKLSAGAHKYTHYTGLVRFVSGKHPRGSASTLVVDEDGRIIPIDVQRLERASLVPPGIFDSEGILDATDHFGSLSNYCCGLEKVGLKDGRRMLLSIGMDGGGAVFQSPTESFLFQLSSSFGSSPQIVNPPLPTCCRCLNDLLAVGRGNGTYTVARIDPEDDDVVVEEFTARGHASNGLCGVEWLGELLLTTSVCGDLSVWDIPQFMSVPEEEWEKEGNDLPNLRSAYSIREFSQQPVVVNCVEKRQEDSLIIGDMLGNIFLSNVELL